ncbi:exonuclease SbcCD subunit D [Patescibacteria group bacterium]
MIKILHTADIHIGKSFRNLGERAEDQTRNLRKTFEKICSLAVEEEVQVMLIAGDLFDTKNPAEKDIDFVIQQLQRAGEVGIHIVIAAGTHDRFATDAFYRDAKWNQVDNIHILTPEQKEVDFESLDCVIHGQVNEYNKSATSPLENLPNNDTRTHSVAMIHGSVAIEGKHAADDYPVTVDEINESPYTYIALGHWHRAQEVVPNKAWYAGSPETLSLEEEGSGNVLIVKLEEDHVEIEPRHIGSIQFDSKDIEVEGDVNLAELIKKIQEDANHNLVRKATLRGVINPTSLVDTRALTAEVKDSFFALKIVDRSSIKLDDESLMQFPDELVIGQYVRILKTQIDDEENPGRKKILEKALQLGVALLSGKEVL